MNACRCLVIWGASVWLMSACATATRPTQALPNAQALVSLELVGTWAEYWSVKGGVDTQRYLFADDGRFAWLAPTHPSPNSSIQKTGTFQLEQHGTPMLVLNVQVERFAACSVQCAHHDAGLRRVEHSTPLVERYEIGECAPNLEAQAVDAHYACRAIAGRAFWRRVTQPAELHEFFE